MKGPVRSPAGRLSVRADHGPARAGQGGVLRLKYAGKQVPGPFPDE
jgi:hypothetical protein